MKTIKWTKPTRFDQIGVEIVKTASGITIISVPKTGRKVTTITIPLEKIKEFTKAVQKEEYNTYEVIEIDEKR